MLLSRRRDALAGVAVGLCVCAVAAAQPRYFHTDLGTLGGNQSHAMDLNEDGIVVGWSTNSSGQKRAFRWENGQMLDLGVLAGESSSEALSINRLGEIVGISGNRAFHWQNGLMTEIPNYWTRGPIVAYDISDAGRVCGWAREADGTQRAFWWEPEWDFLQPLAEPGGTVNSEARAINYWRYTACLSETENTAWRTYYNDVNLVTGLTSPEATDINDAGYMVGGTDTFPTVAWIWRNPNLQILPFPPGRNDAYAHGMNNFGDVVGDSWNYPAYTDLDAWVYYDDTNATHWLEDLDNTTWEFEVAEAINRRGQIVGAGTPFGFGPPRAFLLTPVPAAGFVLVPNSRTKAIHVLDPYDGTPLGTIPIPFTDTPVEIIDGNGADLLLSDQTADTIWRLSPTGALVNEFVQEPVDDIRGIAKSLAGHIVGASGGGFRAWRADGTEVLNTLTEDIHDVELLRRPTAKRYLVSSADDNNVQSYDLNLNFDGQTPPGGISLPQQVEIMGSRIATASYSSGEIVIHRLGDGSFVNRFPVQGLARGVFSMGDDVLIVSTGRGVFRYHDDGYMIETLLSGEGFGYISQCANFKP